MAATTVRHLAAATACLLALAACVVSIDPVVPEGGSTLDERLLGTWEAVSGQDRAVVTRGPEGTYRIEYTREGEVTRLAARKGSLGDRGVLDVWPAPGEDELPDLYSGLMVTGHLLLTVELDGAELRLAALEPKALQERLDAMTSPGLTYRRSEGRMVLQGATEELRAALGPHLSTPGALGEPALYRRPEEATARIPVRVPCFRASAWRDGDGLFRDDPHWMGGDSASTVDLGGGRILWLFGDSWIHPGGAGTRRGARMVSNSVAIQRGRNPATASMRFHWGRADDGGPAAFIPDEGEERHWFGNGVLLDDRLILFMDRVRSREGGLGFESVGWAAWMVDDPEAEPSAWHPRRLETPPNRLGVLVGFAAARRREGHVYAFGSQDPVESHPIFAVRWPVDGLSRGRLHHPEWWGGERLGWLPDDSNLPRRPLFQNAQAELSIHQDAATGSFLAVHTRGFGPADIVMRASPELTGPWSEPEWIYRPPEYDRPRVMIYAAKAHPELEGADLVVTYAINSFELADHFEDEEIYYPRFVRLTRCEDREDRRPPLDH